MNRNTTIAILVIIALAAISWYAYSKSGGIGQPSPTATSTPVVNTPNTPSVPAQASAPVASTNSNAAPTDTTVVMTGSATPNGAATTYWYEFGTSANSMSMKSANQALGSGFRQIYAPAYVTGLTPNTLYYFRLVAENAYGKSTGAQYSFRTTQGVPAPRGSAPTPITLAASSVTRTTANLNGSVDPNQNATEYWFEYGTTQNLGNTVGFISVGSGDVKVPVSASIAGLEPLTTYYFRVNAQNQFGTVNGTIQSLKTAGPAVSPTPSAPKAVTGNETGVTSSKATLRGNVTPNGLETTYWFEYSTDSLIGSLLLQSTSYFGAGSGTAEVAVNTEISGLSSKTNYFYRIVAKNSLGTVRGDIDSFRTK